MRDQLLEPPDEPDMEIDAELAPDSTLWRIIKETGNTAEGLDRAAMVQWCICIEGETVLLNADERAELEAQCQEYSADIKRARQRELEMEAPR